MITTPRRFVTLVLLAIGAQAGAQSTSPFTNCAQPQASGAYLNCALWIDQGQLKRGASGAELGTVGFFSPLPLATVVTGDSALHYALKYERNAQRGMRLGFVGAALTLSGEVFGLVRGCHNVLCSDRSHEIAPVAIAAVGIGFSIVSLPFKYAGERASDRAIWWHNASLGR